MTFDDIDQEFKLYRLRERLQKTAGLWQAFKDHLVAGTAAAGVAAIGTAAGYGLGKLKDTIVKGSAMKGMLEANPSLAKKDSKQVHLAFNSLYHLNPDFATDPLVAGSAVSRFLDRAEGGEGAYVDPQTATTLAKSAPMEDPILHAFMSAKPEGKPPKEKGPAPSEAFEMERAKAVLRKSKDPRAVKNPFTK